jgi:hypothetical protein
LPQKECSAGTSNTSPARSGWKVSRVAAKYGRSGLVPAISSVRVKPAAICGTLSAASSAVFSSSSEGTFFSAASWVFR